MDWVPLHLYSQYSVLEATSSVEALVDKARSLGMPALALTDRGNMYGVVEFCKACKQAGIRPIVGCELAIAPGSRFEKKKTPGLPAGFPVVFLVKNEVGYRNLCALSSLAHVEGFYWTPRIDKELLAAHAEGLICLIGGRGSRLFHEICHERMEEAQKELEWFRSLFGEDCYLELARYPMSNEQIVADGLDQESWLYQQHQQWVDQQEKVNSALLLFSQSHLVRVVATQPARYLEPEDWRAHEILINIQSGEPVEIWEKDSYGNPKTRMLNPKRQVCPTHALYFKSAEQMHALFSDVPQALQESIEISKKCVFSFDFSKKYYPVFVPPYLEGTTFSQETRVIEAEKFLKTLCEEGITTRYTPERLAKVAEKYPNQDPLEVIRARLAYELSVILPKGMGDYLLIVWDFINWAKKKGIPMGPGRGSGAGSIILYLIGITDIEPLRFNLFFERFINPERISYPDIDVDICMDKRSEVIDYTVRKYGQDRVAQIITFGTMKAKMAIKDVGRTLSIPLAKVNQIAKLIPEDPTITLEGALQADPELKAFYEGDEEVRRCIDLARQLEGCVRNTGIHAAGMIISGDPIMSRCPICNAKDSSMAVTQYSMKPVESIGMLKIDFLGLKTLTAIQHAVNTIQKSEGVSIDWINLALEDKPTFDLLNQGKTMGVFQMESTGMQELAKQLHIDKFEEIIAVVSLYRPGPMEMIPSFVNRKHGKEGTQIDHPLMQDILSETYGIMVYQEQVMAIASKLAGYSLGEGDVLRRAMGKKDREEMAKQREKFRLGALKNGVDETTSMTIFDKVEKFASYGFNKSHAAAYGYLGYVTAYLKANYPAHWLAALMTSDRDDLSKVTKHMHEARSLQIAILPPDINESSQEFMPTSKGIRFAMSGIKGVGEGVVAMILEERQKKGGYPSLYDFISRLDTRKIGKKVIENLIEAGCFDYTSWSRPSLLASIDLMYESVSAEQKERARGVLSLFSLMEEEKTSPFDLPPVPEQPMTRQQLLKREHELLGIYLNGHPLDEFRSHLSRLSCVPLSDLEGLAADSVCRIACIVEGVVVKISAKTQRKFAILKIGDGVESLELPIWSDLYEKKGSLMIENQLLYAIIHKEIQDGQMKLQCRWLVDLPSVDESVIAECDTAYDQAQLQVKKMQMRGKMQKPNNATYSTKEKVPPPAATAQSSGQCTIRLNAHVARLSDILVIKRLFRAHSGSIPVEILFETAQGVLHRLYIDKNWGIERKPLLETELGKLSCVESCSWSPS